jgi:tRNA(Ile)-lysidine synthase
LERKVNPSLRTALRRYAEIASAEDASLEALVAKSWKHVSAGRSLRVARVAQLDVGLQRRVVQRWLIEAGIDPDAFDFDAVERVRSLLKSSSGSREVSIADLARVVRSYDRLEFKTGSHTVTFKVKLKIPGRTRVPAVGLQVETRWGRGIVKPRRARVGTWPAEATLSRKTVGRSPVYLRSWQPGDRMRPLGLDGSKKLQDIFTDAKLPREERSRVPVVECRGQIIWLPGYRVAQGWQVEGNRAENLRIILKS